MKKVGILTYHNTTNYGAILQCYALQKYINDNLCNCEVIDYNNSFLKKNYNTNPIKARSFNELIKKTIYFLPECLNHKYFKKFTELNIKLSSIKYTEKNISDSDNVFDLFIAGSDQVWNYNLSGNDNNYFLNFCHNPLKKNSYAASFGSNEIYLNNKTKILSQLKEFNNISVREDEIINLLNKDIKEKEIIQSIDPVFLLKKNDWNLLINKNRICKKPYIFVYEVARTPLLRNFAFELSKKYKLDIIFLSKSGRKMKNAKKLYSVKPIDFIRYIRDAEYIVTSSFHGFAFSLIFEKQFYYDTYKKNGEFSSRLTSLSKISNTEKRKIKENFEDNEFDLINYNNINSILKSEIKKSTIYLEKIIKEHN